jgi:hypothetical protein
VVHVLTGRVLVFVREPIGVQGASRRANPPASSADWPVRLRPAHRFPPGLRPTGTHPYGRPRVLCKQAVGLLPPLLPSAQVTRADPESHHLHHPARTLRAWSGALSDTRLSQPHDRPTESCATYVPHDRTPHIGATAPHVPSSSPVRAAVVDQLGLQLGVERHRDLLVCLCRSVGGDGVGLEPDPTRSPMLRRVRGLPPPRVVTT